MAELATLHRLRDMLAEATGPSREVDGAIFYHLVAKSDPVLSRPDVWADYEANVEAEGVAWAANGFSTPAPRYTASIDAALALAKDTPPNLKWARILRAALAALMRDWSQEAKDYPDVVAILDRSKLPIYILSATVEALIAEQENG